MNTATLNTRTVAARRTRSKATPITRKSRMMLVLMGLFALLIVASYWHLNRDQFAIIAGNFANSGMQDDTVAKPFDSHINKKFISNGVQLGMTAEMVREAHPGAQNSVGRNGEPLIVTQTPRGILVAWLADHEKALDVAGNPYQKAVVRVYRLRVDEVYTHITEQDILARYGLTYGRPIDTSCVREELGGTARCTYRWWGGNGIEVIAISKNKVDANGQAYTMLTTIATNTTKSAKIQAANAILVHAGDTN